MDFVVPEDILKARERFKIFLEENLRSHVSSWYLEGAVPRRFFRAMGKEGWLSFEPENKGLIRRSYRETVMIMEELAAIFPGVAVASLVQIDLGTAGLWLFGSDGLKERYGPPSSPTAGSSSAP